MQFARNYMQQQEEVQKSEEEATAFFTPKPKAKPLLDQPVQAIPEESCIASALSNSLATPLLATGEKAQKVQ